MDKEKEIEEMTAKIAENSYCRRGTCNNCSHHDFCDNFQKYEDVCRLLVEEGYGNIKQYQDEINNLQDDVSLLQTKLSHLEEDFINTDEKLFYHEINAALNEKEIKMQAVREFAEEMRKLSPAIWSDIELEKDIYTYYKQEMGKLFKKLYDEDL